MSYKGSNFFYLVTYLTIMTKIISHTPTNSIIEDDNENEIDFMERVYEMRGTLLHEQKGLMD